MKVISIFFVGILFFQNSVFSESKKKLDYREFLNLSESDIYPVVSKLSKEEAATLISEIRKDARKSYPNIDKFYLLISHLESIKAISEEESRLKSLNLVYLLALVLFVVLLGFVLFRQRSYIKEVNQYLK
ncbi:MAG: hypothetical protein L6Q54_02130 [Leptospiraceae bacterium]|nr:hypothetical protein [Leptospiraceae bacterium]MCK6380036.1 hypothetical protein [Leptospiraceae bacterium]NUM40758.1 hypothetical protein [Leptospiraceae bacterium]